ncbi:GNAT family N-acetyltransferase [Rathayibacter sp. VKM Ac-2759]|uniref:GNAT family N-acetyltransferase n=1 Tax=Rathayibacter sp. VKM Ac-2759 TaxID=2609252 RepID=UPI001FC9589B|nr:GNAT family N-acetyltransferase [Rathayibacter sp. VKM Ac-2759]
MESVLLVRRPTSADITSMARVHAASWRETYRGVMRDAVLDDLDLVGRREHFWTAALTDPQYAQNRIAVAELDGALVGVAMAGPALDPDRGTTDQLYLLYTLAAVHGRGGGDALLEAVLDPGAATGLWVTDPNPRAQAFYRRHGFVGIESKVEDGVREVWMVRRPTV